MTDADAMEADLGPRVLSLLKTGPATTSAIAASLGYSDNRSVLIDTLYALQRRGVIAKSAIGPSGEWGLA